jgi:predicted metallo-beta-lactamase superfamily hydrolase
MATAEQISQVRLLIADTDDTDYIFTDTEITTFLTLKTDNVYLAAASAYSTIARSRGLLAKKVKREGYESEAHAIADLRALAKDLENEAITADGIQSQDFALNDDHFETARPIWRDTDTVVEQ